MEQALTRKASLLHNLWMRSAISFCASSIMRGWATPFLLTIRYFPLPARLWGGRRALSAMADLRAPFNKPVGQPPTLEWIAVERIGVDPGYQRDATSNASTSLIRKIARAWDWRLCLPLSLSRRGDGTLWVVDGQHRLGGAKLRGDIPHLPCVVTSFTSYTDEGSAFVALNRERRALSSMDLFRAAIAAGEEQSVQMMDAITSAGLTLAFACSFSEWKPGMIACIYNIQLAWRQRGEDVVRNALVALAEAFEGKLLRQAGMLLDGLFEIYATAARDPDFDPDLFICVLGGATPEEWAQDAKRRHAEGECRRASMTNAMLDAYREAKAEE